MTYTNVLLLLLMLVLLVVAMFFIQRAGAHIADSLVDDDDEEPDHMTSLLMALDECLSVIEWMKSLGHDEDSCTVASMRVVEKSLRGSIAGAVPPPAKIPVMGGIR